MDLVICWARSNDIFALYLSMTSDYIISEADLKAEAKYEQNTNLRSECFVHCCHGNALWSVEHCDRSVAGATDLHHRACRRSTPGSYQKYGVNSRLNSMQHPCICMGFKYQASGVACDGYKQNAAMPMQGLEKLFG